MTLPTDLTTLSPDSAARIPKILIGNPGDQAQLGWDLIPNWRPRLAEGFSVADGRLRDPDGRALAVSLELTQVLALCDGRTFWDIVQNLTVGGDFSPVTADAADLLKTGRVLGVVHWHFMFASRDGCFLRRRVLGQPPDAHHNWFYLRPFTKAVFDLCSGAYSCRQVADMLAPVTRQPAAAVLPRVIDACQTLIDIGVVGWIDDEQLRAHRLAGLVGASPQPTSAGTWVRTRPGPAT
jgi:hypothetical protein